MSSLDTAGAKQFFGDMTQEEAWDWLEKNVRTAVAYELDLLRNQQNLSQGALAQRIGATQPMLSRFFKVGDDGRSPTLDTLVKLAWGVNRYVEINLVSEIPSRLVLNPPEAPAGSWPTPIPADATGTSFISLDGSPQLKSHEIKLEAMPDKTTYQPVVDTSFAVELYPPQRKEGQNSQSLPFQVQVRLVTDIKDGGNAGKRLLRVRTTLDVNYLIDPKAPKEELDGLEAFARKRAIQHAWPVYGDILKTAVARTGMTVEIVRRVQKHLTEYMKDE